MARIHEAEGAGCADRALENFRQVSLDLWLSNDLQGETLQGRAGTNRKFTIQLSCLSRERASFPSGKAERSQKMMRHWVKSLEKSCLSSEAKLAQESRLLWIHYT